MLEKIVREIGVRKTARACGVNPTTVLKWFERGLPSIENAEKKMRRAHYERTLAKLKNISVADLRKQLKESEK